MAMAGNAGIQSAAVAVQGLASGSAWSSGVGRRLLRELLVALMNGTAVALLLAGLILIVSAVITMHAPVRLALTAGVSLVIVIFLAGTIGAVTPIILHRLGIDPALATGPVITTSNDVLGVLVFFSVATLLYIGV
jgi:magnesium transporter